jgi:hypothetical protein
MLTASPATPNSKRSCLAAVECSSRARRFLAPVTAPRSHRFPLRGTHMCFLGCVQLSIQSWQQNKHDGLIRYVQFHAVVSAGARAGTQNGSSFGRRYGYFSLRRAQKLHANHLRQRGATNRCYQSVCLCREGQSRASSNPGAVLRYCHRSCNNSPQELGRRRSEIRKEIIHPAIL